MNTPHQSAPARDTLPPDVFERMARAITPDLLIPYHVPARAFPLGTDVTFCIRADYRAQVPDGSGTPRTPAGVQRLVHQLAAALDAQSVDAEEQESDVISATARRNAVIVCSDTLQRLPDPGLMLRALQRTLCHALVAVVAMPLRELALDTDDLGPPASPAFARMWTFPELQACLDAYGMEPLFGGLLPDDPDGVAGPPIGVIVVAARPSTALSPLSAIG